MEQLVEQNFKRAMKLPMPKKTFAKLNVDGEYMALTVRTGLINKHLTSEQLMLLAQIEKHGAVKYSASHSFIISVPKVRLQLTIDELTAVGLYVVYPQDSAVIKCCDFCDGDCLEALPMTRQLLQKVEQLKLKQRVHIGFNACTLACYNAVRDNLALIYHNGKIDIYAGAIPMGRRASSGQLIVKNIPEDQIVEAVLYILSMFESSSTQKFETFIRQEKNLAQALEKRFKKGD